MREVRKKEKISEEVDKNERKFPSGACLFFLFKWLLTMAIIGAVVFFVCVLVEILFGKWSDGIRQLAILAVEVIVCTVGIVLSNIDISFVNNNVKIYKIRRRRGLLNLYKFLRVLLFIAVILIPLLTIKTWSKNNQVLGYSSDLIYYVKTTCTTIVVFFVSKKIITDEIDEVDFYSCKYCNLLNVMEYDTTESSYYLKEHFHEETDKYSGSADIKEHMGNGYWSTSEKVDISIEGPTRKVSDGVYKHENMKNIYRCCRCHSEKERNYDIDRGRVFRESDF